MASENSKIELVLRVSWRESADATADDVWDAFNSVLRAALKNGGWDVLGRYPELVIENEMFSMFSEPRGVPSRAVPQQRALQWQCAAVRELVGVMQERIDELREMLSCLAPEPDDVVPQSDTVWPEPAMEPIQTFYDSDFVTVAVAAGWYRRLTPAGRAVLDLPETRRHAWCEMSTNEAVRLMWEMVGRVGISKDLTYKLRDLAWEIVGCAQNRAGGVGSDLEALEWEALRDLTQIFMRAPFPGPPPVPAPFYLNVDDREDDDPEEDVDATPFID